MTEDTKTTSNKIAVTPDVHGRTFWKAIVKNAEDYRKIVFLGDYLDPYEFEGITIEDAIENFKEILEFKKQNMDDVVLLLGNHDMPYFSSVYKAFSLYHSRMNLEHWMELNKLFTENKKLFRIAYTERGILFTHAGVNEGWLKSISRTDDYDKEIDIHRLSYVLDTLMDTKEGLKKLFRISRERGGYDKFGSCIWSDVEEMVYEQEKLMDERHKISPIMKVKQVFGHTLQAYYSKDGIKMGQPIEFMNIKMLDNGCAYELDVTNFTVSPVNG